MCVSSSSATKNRRWVWLVALIVAVSLYFPINRLASGGVALETALDAYIPLAPIWIVPYLGALVLFVLILLWAYLRMPAEMFAAFATSNLIASGVAYVIYLAYPTYVLRPTISGTDTLSRGMKWLYASDRAYNAFPSGHTFYTVLAWLYLWRWRPRIRPVATVVAALILLSTLFTRQHYVPDLIGGIALALVSFWLGTRLASRSPHPPRRADSSD
jgi:membrane-associated phospholipid phosphatase